MWFAFAVLTQVLAPPEDHACFVAARFVRQPRVMVERTAAALNISRTWTDTEVEQVAYPFVLDLMDAPNAVNGGPGAALLATEFRARVQAVAEGRAPHLAQGSPPLAGRNWARCELAGY